MREEWKDQSSARQTASTAVNQTVHRHVTARTLSPGTSSRLVPLKLEMKEDKPPADAILPRRRLMHVPPLAQALSARRPQFGPAAVMGNRQRAADSEGGA